MDTELIKANLNLHAVLQNLEDLVRLDPEMAARAQAWSITIQFTVRGGPAAYVAFDRGACRHGIGTHPNPTVKLFFNSPSHLNRMFDGKAMPIPLKGITRLGFLKRDFAQLTDRLALYLKPDNGKLADPAFLRINTILTLHTAVYAVQDLATLEPISRQVAAHTPAGILQIEVLPDGPFVHLTFDKGSVRAAKGAAKEPLAKMTFQDLQIAHDLLSGDLDAFLAVAEGKILLQGMIPMVDNVGLILDRVAMYLA